MDTAHNGETSGDRSLDLPIKTLDDKPPIQLLYPGAVFEYGSFPLYSYNRFSLLGRWTLFSNFFIGSLFPEYMANCQIIEKYAPGILALPPPKKGQEYLWEKTAGAGIVPKWVSWIGLGAIACLAGSVTWLLVWLWPG